ncbi:MAG TPA: class I SAM-dependent methyltransferase [Prolixibacteraceae bacterium]|jgi:SAM-dependent methyltransferase
MDEYWESRFKNEGEMWKLEPSDSALLALDLFKANGIRKILIPGFGYGRNARVFIKNGLEVTGIEISQSAIDLAKANGLDCTVHHGSVTSMPFDNTQYEGIFCYALIHLLNKSERQAFLKACYSQLSEGGWMVFVVASTWMNMYGTGKNISKDRFEVSKGLNVFFYHDKAVSAEFSNFGLISCSDIDEPVKYMRGYEPMKLKLVICQKRK